MPVITVWQSVETISFFSNSFGLTSERIQRLVAAPDDEWFDGIMSGDISVDCRHSLDWHDDMDIRDGLSHAISTCVGQVSPACSTLYLPESGHVVSGALSSTRRRLATSSPCRLLAKQACEGSVTIRPTREKVRELVVGHRLYPWRRDR